MDSLKDTTNYPMHHRGGTRLCFELGIDWLHFQGAKRKEIDDNHYHQLICRDEIILSKLPNIQFLNSCFFPHYSFKTTPIILSETQLEPFGKEWGSNFRIVWIDLFLPTYQVAGWCELYAFDSTPKLSGHAISPESSQRAGCHYLHCNL